MVNLITELSKYVMTLLLALYTLLGFWLVRKKGGTLAAGCVFSMAASVGESDLILEYAK